MFLSFLSCSLFSYAANPRAVIVKCDGCAYDVDVDVDVDAGCPSFRGINVKMFQSMNLVMTYQTRGELLLRVMH